MTQTVRDFENTFVRAWQLLSHNWLLIVPGLVLGLVGGIVAYFLAVLVYGSILASPATGDVALVTQIVVAVVSTVVSLLVAIVQMAYVTGMAGQAWRNEHATLADGWYAFSHRSIQTTIAVVLLFAIGVCAAALAPITFLITLFAYMVFFLYTLASVIIGNRTAVEALVQSAQLSVRNIAPTIGLVVLISIIAIAGGWIGGLLGHVAPVAGGIVAGVIQQIIVAYASLVVAGEYLKLSNQAEG